MSKVLFLSNHADGYGLATKMVEQGDEVDFYIQEEKFQRTGEGKTNPRVLKQAPAVTRDYDLVIPDMVRMGRLADRYRKAGKVVLSGGALGDTIELDRAYGQKVASLGGVKIPPSEEFQTIPEGVKYLQKNKKPHVFKPLGNKSPAMTFVSMKDNRALMTYMAGLKNIGPYLLQEKVDGIEISTEVWFDGRDPVLPINHTIEHKRFMEGDKGPNTGCMGNIVWASDPDKIVKTAFEPLYPFFKKARYIGPLDMNLILSKDTAWFLEFTCRFGYDAIQALGELVKEEWFKIFHGVATHTLPRIPMYKGKYAIGVRLSMPPYPQDEEVAKLHGVQVVDIPTEASPHVWLSDVYYLSDGTPVIAGVDGVVGCVTAWGETVREARRRVYRTIENISVCGDLQYRSDIGEGTEEKIKQLKEWGWLNA